MWILNLNKHFKTSILKQHAKKKKAACYYIACNYSFKNYKEVSKKAPRFK